MVKDKEETFICSACGEEYELVFRAKQGWERDYDDEGYDTGETYVEICGNCHGPSVCVGMKPTETLLSREGLPF